MKENNSFPAKDRLFKSKNIKSLLVTNFNRYGFMVGNGAEKIFKWPNTLDIQSRFVQK